MTKDGELAKNAIDAAIWVTASPHEWEWTHEQQVAMARYVVWASSRIQKLQHLVDTVPLKLTALGCDVGKCESVELWFREKNELDRHEK